VIRLLHPPGWRVANSYLELFVESPSGQCITYAKFDNASAGQSAGSGLVAVADRDGGNPRLLPPAVRVTNSLYGAFQQWLGGDEDFLVFANQPDRAANVGQGYVFTPQGRQVATFDGISRCANPADGRRVVYSAHESMHVTATRGHVGTRDVWTNEGTVLATIQDASDYYDGAETLPTTWDDIYSKHPKWSPDGKKIVFSYGHDPDTSLWRKLFCIRLDKGGAVEFVCDYEVGHHHVWHPNSQEVVMVRTDTSPTSVGAVDIDTGNVRELIANVNGFSTHCAISPDALKVATDTSAATAPVVVHTLGKAPPASVRRVYTNAVLDTVAGAHCHTQWSRDSESLFFIADTNRMFEWAPGQQGGNGMRALASRRL